MSASIRFEVDGLPAINITVDIGTFTLSSVHDRNHLTISYDVMWFCVMYTVLHISGHIVCSTCSSHAVFESKSTYHRICDRCFVPTIPTTKTDKSPTEETCCARSRRLSDLSHSRSPLSPVLRPRSSPSMVDEDGSLHNLRPLSPPHQNNQHLNQKIGAVQDTKRKLTITYHQSMHSVSDHDVPSTPYWVNRRDLLVRGYLRRLRLQDANDRNPAKQRLPWLPQDIIGTLIEWSFINDVWKQYGKHSEDHIAISDSAQSIQRISRSNEHCYYGFGRDVVTSDLICDGSRGIKTWNVRLDTTDYYTNNYCSMIIGVAEQSKVNWIKSLLGDFTYGCYRGYGLRVAERCRFVHQHANQPIFINKGSLKKGDLIRVTLDLSGNGPHGMDAKDSKYGSLGFVFEDGYGTEIEYGLNDEFGWMGRRRHIAFDRVPRNRAYVLVVGLYCQNKLTFVEQCN